MVAPAPAGGAGPAGAPGPVRPSIVVVGSANMDLVVTAPHLPRAGETVLGREFTMVPGGKGANQAIAAARAGAGAMFLGALGSDSFGVTLRARLEASTVDTTLTRTSYGGSGVAVIMVDAAGENQIVVSPGANAAFVDLTAGELAAIAAADVLVAQLEIPLGTVTAAAVAARAAGTRVVLNAAPVVGPPHELLAAVDLLVVNEIEAGMLAREWVGLLELVPRVVVTAGARGAWYADRAGATVEVPAVPVESVDSTAAGDAFTGALATAWAEGRDVVDAVRWACAAGAACVRRLGASSALPRRAEIDQLYAQAYG